MSEYKIGRFIKCLELFDGLIKGRVVVEISHYNKNWSYVSFWQTSLWFDCPVCGFTRLDRKFEYRKDCLRTAMAIGEKLGLPVYICKVAHGSEILQQLARKDSPKEKDKEMMLNFVRGKYPYSTSWEYIVEKATVK